MNLNESLDSRPLATKRRASRCWALSTGLKAWPRRHARHDALGLHAADVFADVVGRHAQLPEGLKHRAAGTQRVLAGFGLARLHTLPQLLAELEALLGVGQRVVAEVALVGARVEAVVGAANALVEVVAIGQLRLGRARRDLGELGGFLLRRGPWGKGLVGVLDGPVVVGAQRRVRQRGPGLTLERQVVGVVVHHRVGDAVGLGEGLVLQLGLGDGGGRAEVVLEAQRVAHLMHDHVLHDGLGQRLGLGAVHVHAVTQGQQVQREAELGGLVGHIGAGLLGQRHAAALAHPAGRLGLVVVVVLVEADHVVRREAARTAAKDVAHADVGVEDFAGARVTVARADGKADVRPGEPADGRMRRVHVVPVGIVGLLLGLNRVLEADLLEGLVPLQDAGLDRLAVLGGDVLVHPVDDGLHRLGQRRARVLLLQAPAGHQVHARVGLQVVAEVAVALHEMTQARVGHGARRPAVRAARGSCRRS